MPDYYRLPLRYAAISGIARSCFSIYSGRLPSPATASMAAISSSDNWIRRGRLGVLYTAGRPIFLLACFFMVLCAIFNVVVIHGRARLTVKCGWLSRDDLLCKKLACSSLGLEGLLLIARLPITPS